MCFSVRLLVSIFGAFAPACCIVVLVIFVLCSASCWGESSLEGNAILSRPKGKEATREALVCFAVRYNNYLSPRNTTKYRPTFRFPVCIFSRSHSPPPPPPSMSLSDTLATSGVVTLQPTLVPHVSHAAAAAAVHPSALLPQSALQHQPRDAAESSPGGTVVIFDWVETLRDLLSRTDYSSHPPAATDSETRNTPPFPTIEKEEDEEDEEEPLEAECSAEDLVEIVHGQAFTDRKSTFQAHLSRVSSETQVRYEAIRLGYSWKLRWVTSRHPRRSP